MSIKETAYDTTACAGFKTADILDSLMEANIKNDLNKIHHKSIRSDLAFDYSLVQGGNSSSDNIRFFGHPIIYNTGSKDSKGLHIKELALDVRNFGKWYQPTEQFVIRNNPEFNWSVNRLILNAFWLKERPEVLRDVSIIPAAVYSSLISECISRRYALNFLEQNIVSILSCYFYYSSFTNETHFDDLEYSKLISYINRATKVPAEIVVDNLKFLDKVVMNNLQFLCDCIKAKTENVSLRDLNTGMIFALCCNTWYGHNAKEILAVGLEHPPTWLMITYASLEEATYKKSVLSKISDRFNKANNGDNFIKAIKTLILGNENS